MSMMPIGSGFDHKQMLMAKILNKDSLDEAMPSLVKKYLEQMAADTAERQSAVIEKLIPVLDKLEQSTSSSKPVLIRSIERILNNMVE